MFHGVSRAPVGIIIRQALWFVLCIGHLVGATIGRPWSGAADAHCAPLQGVLCRITYFTDIFYATGISTVIKPTVISGTCATTSAFGFIADVGP